MPQESILALIRRVPTAQGVEYARSLMDLFRWRPDLRQQYSGHDLAFIESMAKRDEKREYAKDSSDHYETLADFYASTFNDFLDAGQPVTTAMREDADDELADGDWVVDYDGERWASKRAEPERYAMKEPVRDADGRFAKAHVTATKRELASGKRAVKTASEAFPSDVSGLPIKRHVEMTSGAKIHPDELHRLRHDDDGEHYLSTDEMLTVNPGTRSAASAKSFAHALAGLANRVGGNTTIQGPHGYSATLPNDEWRKLGRAPGPFHQWLDSQGPEDLKSKASAVAPKPSTTIGSEKDTQDFFAGRDAGQGRLFAKAAGQWITIGGSKGEDGKRHGGSPVYVEGGRITKGHPSLTGKKIDALDKPGEGGSVRDANRKEADYTRATWAKKAKADGIPPAHLHSLAGEIIAHDKASKADLTKMLAEVRKNYPHLKSVSVNQGRTGSDHTTVKDIDQIANSLAHSREYGHLFGGTEDYEDVAKDQSEKLHDYLVAGTPEPMSEADAYEQAYDHLMNHQHANATASEIDEAVPFAKHRSTSIPELLRYFMEKQDA